jgi:hypothetical protein
MCSSYCTARGEIAARACYVIALALEPGSVVDGFRIVARHSTGGMATVYRAIEVATGRAVALKLCAEPRLADALAREHAALAAIGAAPHVAALVRAG